MSKYVFKLLAGVIKKESNFTDFCCVIFVVVMSDNKIVNIAEHQLNNLTAIILRWYGRIIL